jgi:hypothetical protein
MIEGLLARKQKAPAAPEAVRELAPIKVDFQTGVIDWGSELEILKRMEGVDTGTAKVRSRRGSDSTVVIRTGTNGLPSEIEITLPRGGGVVTASVNNNRIGGCFATFPNNPDSSIEHEPSDMAMDALNTFQSNNKEAGAPAPERKGARSFVLGRGMLDMEAIDELMEHTRTETIELYGEVHRVRKHADERVETPDAKFATFETVVSGFEKPCRVKQSLDNRFREINCEITLPDDNGVIEAEVKLSHEGSPGSVTIVDIYNVKLSSSKGTWEKIRGPKISARKIVSEVVRNRYSGKYTKYERGPKAPEPKVKVVASDMIIGNACVKEYGTESCLVTIMPSEREDGGLLVVIGLPRELGMITGTVDKSGQIVSVFASNHFAQFENAGPYLRTILLEAMRNVEVASPKIREDEVPHGGPDLKPKVAEPIKGARERIARVVGM